MYIDVRTHIYKVANVLSGYGWFFFSISEWNVNERLTHKENGEKVRKKLCTFIRARGTWFSVCATSALDKKIGL